MPKNQFTEHIKSSWFKYFFEIIVVVAGILIAVGIDSRIERKKAQEDEIQALKQIHKGLERIREEAIINLEDEVNVLTSCRYILDNFDKNEGLNDSLKTAFSLAWFYTYIQPDYGPYDYVNNYGASVITNSELRETILNLYGLDLRATVGESKIRGTYIENLKPMMAQWYKSLNPNTYYLESAEPWDYSKLRTDQEFHFHLKTQLNEAIRWSRELSGLKEHVEEVMQQVSDEIKRLER